MIFNRETFVSIIGLAIVTVFVGFGSCISVANAQESDTVGNSEEEFFSEEENIMIAARKEVLSSYDVGTVRPSIPSLLFLPGEHKLLQAAKAHFLARIPSDEELNGGNENGEVLNAIRTVSLGGILYKNDNTWVVWINNQRITPNALPEEIIDLKVYSEYINIKWLDVKTNKVYPIRLRPNQTFNLDARMFLPS